MYMAQYHEICEKLFINVLDKLVACGHSSASRADKTKEEYHKFMHTVVKSNPLLF